MKRVDLVARFTAKISAEPNSGCWLWTGAIMPHGYGRFGLGGRYGKSVLAHRVSYELHVGPIPDGTELDHLCRVTCCVNPRHLEPVTHRENLLRGTGPAARANDTHCQRGHAFDEANTAHYSGRRHCRACLAAHARRYRRERRA